MRRNLFDPAVCLTCLALIGYFAWHGLEGPRNVEARRQIAEERQRYERELEKTRARREALEARVALMRPEQVDPDMLEELARVRLGYARPGDVLVWQKAR